MTVYWVVWDAAASWIVNAMDAERALPAVRRLRERGITAVARPPAPNCQTPPSLATLFTGTWPAEHGVTGFTVPGPPTGPVAAVTSGFAADFPLRPTVWRTAAEHGVRSAFVHAPWVFDGDGNVAAGTEAAIEAYSSRRSRHDRLPVVPGWRHSWPVTGFETTVTARDGAVRLDTGAGLYELGADDDWTPVRLPDGLGFWARYVHAGGPAVVRTGIWAPRAGGSDTALTERLARAPLFAGEGVGSYYRSGLLGPRLVDGGDGSAEEIFLGSVRCAHRAFDGAARTVLAGTDADLVVIYLPTTDDVGHEFAGWCDTASLAYRPDVADAVWTLLKRCYQDADSTLGRVLDRAGPDDTVLLTADHGMVGSAFQVNVNEHLIEAGFAASTADGAFDPARSSVIYHPAGNGSLVVNDDARPGGVVPADHAARTLRQAMASLSGLAGVRGFVDEHGGPTRPEDTVAFLVLDDDYQPSAAVDGGAVVRPMGKTGAHVVNTGTDRLHAVFAAAGPGLSAGLDLGVVDNTLPAALVAHQLGFGAPPDHANLKSSKGTL
ncbi:alkaline phosphatase family protein [Amycolatopsis sp. NPDC059657]|uniref:alkaline phosphatase family protein n=1 Tax=Amycolatopsis sp. NPDC059657 TaxID=3346899 RepID=UPI00366D148E